MPNDGEGKSSVDVSSRTRVQSFMEQRTGKKKKLIMERQ